MTELLLDATVRTVKGKSGVRQLRREGSVPGVMYGRGDPLSVQMPTAQAQLVVQLLHGSERLVTVRLDGKDEKQVILKEVQTKPAVNTLLHIDLFEIDVTQEVVVIVEVRPIGQAAGVILGGILQTITREVEVECLPSIIPEYLEADVTELEIGDNFHVRDLEFPENVRCVTSLDETLFVISVQMAEEEEEVEEEGLLEAGEIPEDGAEDESEGAAAEDADEPADG